MFCKKISDFSTKDSEQKKQSPGESIYYNSAAQNCRLSGFLYFVGNIILWTTTCDSELLKKKKQNRAKNPNSKTHLVERNENDKASGKHDL